MTVTFAGDQAICSNNDLNFAECVQTAGGVGTACPGTTYVYTCPTGPNSLVRHAPDFEQKTGFKVNADYSGGSTAADCTPGQILQETITSEGAGEPNPNINPTSLNGDQSFGALDTTIDNNAGNQFPQVGAAAAGRQSYGGDNYIAGAVDVISSQTDAGSQWYDNPDQNKDNDAENATWQFRFLSYVNGSAGEDSCSCAFQINVDWPGNSDPATVFEGRADGSVNCNYVQ